MPTLDISSALAKIDRAEEHALAIAAEVKAWDDGRPHALTRQVNRDFTRYSVHVKTLVRPDLKRMSVMFGDCIGNARSALDHAFHAIVTQVYKGPAIDPDERRRMNFPIERSPEAFQATWKKRYKVLGDKVKAILEPVQPYHRPHAELPNLLALLSKLTNTDKHNLIIPPLHQAGLIKFTVHFVAGNEFEDPPTFVVNKGSLEDGDEIGAITYPRPHKHIRYEFNTAFSVYIEHKEGPNGRKSTAITRLSREIVAEVRDVVGIVAAAVK